MKASYPISAGEPLLWGKIADGEVRADVARSGAFVLEVSSAEMRLPLHVSVSAESTEPTELGFDDVPVVSHAEIARALILLRRGADGRVWTARTPQVVLQSDGRYFTQPEWQDTLDLRLVSISTIID